MSSTIYGLSHEPLLRAASRGAHIRELLRPSVQGDLTKHEIEDLFQRLRRSIAFSPSDNGRRMVVLQASSDELAVLDLAGDTAITEYTVSLRLSLRNLNLELAVISGVIADWIQVDGPSLERLIDATH